MRFKLLPNRIQKLFHEKNQNACETDYRFRFITLWNGFCNPFHKKNCKFFYETEYRICFTVLWNGICIPFHKKIAIFFETEYRFCFLTLWNEFCIPFHKKICNFFMKRITESVSQCYEMESVIRFPYILIFPLIIKLHPTPLILNLTLMFVAGSGML